MIFAGIQKLTLLDYPAHTACTIFLKGCNFRCPFCHNFDILEMEEDEYCISRDEIISFLKNKIGKLQGVCLTGGEVLVNPVEEVYDFINIIRNMGYKVKLDTNGYFPDKIEFLLDKKVLDYIAMDIKSGEKKYSMTCGITNSFNIENIKKSIDLIINSNIDYEFRTTLVKGIHDESDIKEIKEMIKGAKNYYFQNYRHIEGMKELPYKNFLKEEILNFKKIIGNSVENCELRGIDG